MSARFDRRVGQHPAVALFGLPLLAVYFLVSYRVALTNLGVAAPPTGAPVVQGATWLGRWRMFTELRPRHTELVAETEGGDGLWVRVDLDSLYPNHWDEGPGYLRDDFLTDPRRVAGMAADLCVRTGAKAVRLTEVTWAKSPGQAEQPHVDEARADRGMHPCR